MTLGSVLLQLPTHEQNGAENAAVFNPRDLDSGTIEAVTTATSPWRCCYLSCFGNEPLCIKGLFSAVRSEGTLECFRPSVWLWHRSGWRLSCVRKRLFKFGEGKQGWFANIRKGIITIMLFPRVWGSYTRLGKWTMDERGAERYIHV